MSPAPPHAPAFLAIRGRAIAPGMACGPLRRNRPDLSPRDAEGSILLAERAVPDDVGRILAAAGTLTISGAVLSHVSLLSREFGKASVSLSGMTPAHLAREGEDGILVFDDVVGAVDRPVLAEGDLLFVDGSQGVVGIPGGMDRPRRRSRTYAPLLATPTPPTTRPTCAPSSTKPRASDAAFAFLPRRPCCTASCRRAAARRSVALATGGPADTRHARVAARAHPRGRRAALRTVASRS
jgi:hypothetical protein